MVLSSGRSGKDFAAIAACSNISDSLLIFNFLPLDFTQLPAMDVLL
jgi:hypothetical protein